MCEAVVRETPVTAVLFRPFGAGDPDHTGEESYDLQDRFQVVAMGPLARELTRVGRMV